MSVPVVPAPRRWHQNGFTLIELLVAAGIAAVLLAAVFALLRTAGLTVGGQKTRIEGDQAAAAALDSIERDLMALVQDEDESACQTRLTVKKDGRTRLAFCTTVAEPGDDNLPFYRIDHVEYRLVERDGERVLIRSASPTIGPGAALPPATNSLLRNAEAFEVRLFNGAEGRVEWPLPEEPRLLPSRASVSLAYRDGRRKKMMRREIPILNALSVTSRLERTTGYGVTRRTR